MKGNIKTAGFLIAALILGGTVTAQDTKAGKMEKEKEIVIRQKGDQKEKTTIVIEGDKVTINGKPMDEFKEGNIKVMKIERRGKGMIADAPPAPPHPPLAGRERRIEMDREEFRILAPELAGNKALLGVTTEKSGEGAKVSMVSEGSGAEKAGLKTGDIITKVGSEKIAGPDDLVKEIGKHKPNEKVDISYLRDGKNNKTSATLGENKMHAFTLDMPNNNFRFEMPPSLDGAMFNWYKKPKLGLQIQDMEEGKGVKVKEVDEDFPAATAGFKEGDVITEVNGKKVDNVDTLREQVRNIKEGEAISMGFNRNGKNQSVEIKIPKKLKTADL